MSWLQVECRYQTSSQDRLKIVSSPHGSHFCRCSQRWDVKSLFVCVMTATSLRLGIVWPLKMNCDDGKRLGERVALQSILKNLCSSLCLYCQTKQFVLILIGVYLGLLWTGHASIYIDVWACRRWMLVCMAWIYTASYVFYFSLRRAQRNGRDSGIDYVLQHL